MVEIDDVEIDDFEDGDDETEDTDLIADSLMNDDEPDGIAIPGSHPNGTRPPGATGEEELAFP